MIHFCTSCIFQKHQVFYKIGLRACFPSGMTAIYNWQQANRQHLCMDKILIKHARPLVSFPACLISQFHCRLQTDPWRVRGDTRGCTHRRNCGCAICFSKKKFGLNPTNFFDIFLVAAEYVRILAIISSSHSH
jgi:hypothetical protein